MATTRTARRNGQGRNVRQVFNASGHPKMQIIAEGGTAFTVPYAPREGSLDGVVPVFESVPRGGRKPLLLRAGDSLEVYSFELVVGHPDPQVDVDTELAELRSLAGSGKRLTVRLDEVTARHPWRMTAYSQQVAGRVHGSNGASRAVVSITLTEVSDPAVNLGPLTGGKSGQGDKDRPKFVVWKKGMSLRGLAEKYYGKGSRWHRIADDPRNKIRDPKKIKPGTKVYLP